MSVDKIIDGLEAESWASRDSQPSRLVYLPDAVAAVKAAFAAGRAAATPPDGTNPHDDRNRMTKARREGFDEGWAARAAATPDPPCAHGLTGGRGAAERCFECGASVTAASPDERLREALALVYVMLTGAEPMWAEMPVEERCARAANEAQQAFLSLGSTLAAADRDGERIPDSEFVVPPLLPPDPITERMIDVADDAFRHGSSDEQAWRECLGDALHAVYPLIRERVMAEMVQGKVPAADREENTDG